MTQPTDPTPRSLTEELEQEIQDAITAELDAFREERDSDAGDLTVQLEEGEDPADMSEENAMVRDAGGDIPKRPDPAGFEPTPAIMTDPYQDLRKQVEERFSKVFNEKTVVVAEDERQRFLRSALMDEPMWFDITIPGLQTSVRVVPASTAWSDTAATVVSQMQKNLQIGESLNSWIEAFQTFHIWLQVDQIDGIPKPWFQAKLEELRDAGLQLPGNRALIALLSDESVFDSIRVLGAAQRYLLLSAIRIAEIKMTLCMDAMSDGSFFSSAGTN